MIRNSPTAVFSQPDGTYTIEADHRTFTRPLIALGWKWARGIGCPGCFYTQDQRLAQETAEKLKVPVRPVTWSKEATASLREATS